MTGPFRFGPTWKRCLSPLAPQLPAALATRLKIPEANTEASFAQGALAVSLSHLGAPELPRPTCALLDSHGCRYRPMDSVPSDAGGENGNLTFFPFFPRREATFRLEAFVDTEGGTPAVGSISLPRPLPTHYPTWKAEALPATRTSGPLSVTLTGVTTGWSRATPRRPAAAYEAQFTRLTFHCADASRQWEVAGVSLADSMGGRYRSQLWRMVPGVLYVEGDNLCRREPAYRYQLEFSRALSHTAKPDRIYRFPVRQVSPASGSHSLEPMKMPDGRRLVVDYLQGNRDYKLRVTWQPRIGELGRLWAFDPNGQLIGAAWPNIPRDNPQIQVLTVTVPVHVRQLELGLGVYDSRFATFTVKPRWITR